MSVERIEVSLGKSGRTIVFESVEEIEIWVRKEEAAWSWLYNPPQTNLKNIICGKFNNFFPNVLLQINQAKDAKKKAVAANQMPDLKTYYESIKSYFSQCYGQQLCPSSGTPLAKFIIQLRSESGDSVAAAAMAFSMRCNNLHYNLHDEFKGALIGFAFESGLQERKSSESQALEEMRLEWEKKFQIFRDALTAETETHKKLNADGGQLISKQDTAHKELLTKHETALNDLIAKAKKDWADLNKTYDDALAVRSPVNYWTKKAKTHFWLAWAYAAVAAVVAGVSLAVLIPEVKSMMEIPKGIPDPEKWHPEYWRFAVLIASALFCVWVVRILVRLLLSNIHLHTDARERVTMVQTYLALLRRGKIKDDERMFILQTLFRPTPTGIVKDDAVPLTVVEGITKLGR